MKKRIGFNLSLLLLAGLTLGGCTSKDLSGGDIFSGKEQSKTSETEVETEKTKKKEDKPKAHKAKDQKERPEKRRKKERRQQIDYHVYDGVKKKYADFIKNTDQEDPTINSMAFLANQDFYTGIYQTEEDLDGNGIAELLVALGDQDGKYHLLDLYSLTKESDLVRLTKGRPGLEMIGEREQLFPLKDGSLMEKGSSSAFETHFTHYQFTEEGTALSVLDEGSDYSRFEAVDQPIDLGSLAWKSVASGHSEQKPEKKESAKEAAISKDQVSNKLATIYTEVTHMINDNYNTIGLEDFFEGAKGNADCLDFYKFVGESQESVSSSKATMTSQTVSLNQVESVTDAGANKVNVTFTVTYQTTFSDKPDLTEVFRYTGIQMADQGDGTLKIVHMGGPGAMVKIS